MKNTQVMVEYSRRYDKQMLDHIFSCFDLVEDLMKANYIVIKPNFSAGQHAAIHSHVVSDLAMIGELITQLLSIAPEKIIYIAESDSTAYGFAFLKFENLDLYNSLKIDPSLTKNLRLLDLSRDRLVRVRNKQFKYFNDFQRQLWLSKTLMECDFIIDATNLKTHTTTGFTGACKNLFGTLPRSEKWVLHTHISDIIHDLTLAIRPHICIVDGFYGMDFNGPVAGRPIDAGFRVWSRNAACADIISCRMSNIAPGKIKHISRLASTLGINIEKLISETELDTTKAMSLHPPEKLPQVIERIGLLIQHIGEYIQYFGRRIVCKAPSFQRKKPGGKTD